VATKTVEPFIKGLKPRI